MSNATGPSISVLALSRNHGRFVAACLRSIFDADQPCEIVFVDNGSRDDSLAVARSVLAEAPPHITSKVVALNPELPLCRFFNIAVRESSGDFIKPIATDDKLGPNFFPTFRQLVQISDERVGAWLTGSVIIDADDHVKRPVYGPQLFGGPDDGPPVWLTERHIVHANTAGAPEYTACSMFYRRDVYTKLGGYNERFRFEDRPFLFDVLKHGWRVPVYPFNNSYYRDHSHGISANPAWMAEARVPILLDHALRAEWRNKPFALFHLARNARVVAMNRLRNRRGKR